MQEHFCSNILVLLVTLHFTSYFTFDHVTLYRVNTARSLLLTFTIAQITGSLFVC